MLYPTFIPRICHIDSILLGISVLLSITVLYGKILVLRWIVGPVSGKGFLPTTEMKRGNSEHKMEESVLEKLCSKAKLDRDKGLQELQVYLQNADKAGVKLFEERFSAILSDSSAAWECKHGALMGSKSVCQTKLCSDDFSSYLIEQALQLADDSEFRVRIAAGKVADR